MAQNKHKPLMRSLGEFFGHIVKGIKTNPAKAKDQPQRTVIREEVQEEQHGDVVLRRTTIEEVEVRPETASDPDEPADST
jgi:hypothetical protein